jgi:hypothetical protein
LREVAFLESKNFFFEKKKQNFFSFGPRVVSPARSKLSKFFCFFLFTKRSAFFLFYVFEVKYETENWGGVMTDAIPSPKAF